MEGNVNVSLVTKAEASASSEDPAKAQALEKERAEQEAKEKQQAQEYERNKRESGDYAGDVAFGELAHSLKRDMPVSPDAKPVARLGHDLSVHKGPSILSPTSTRGKLRIGHMFLVTV